MAKKIIKARPVEPCRKCNEGVLGAEWAEQDGLCRKCYNARIPDTLLDYSNDGREEMERQAMADRAYEGRRSDGIKGH